MAEKADLRDLVQSLSEEKVKSILLKFAERYKDLREEILACEAVSSSKYDDLMVKEWQRRFEDAIERDKSKADIEEWYGSGTVVWDETEKVLREAVEDFYSRGLIGAGLDFLDEAQDTLIDSEDEFWEGDYDSDIYMEYEGLSEGIFDQLRLSLSKDDEKIQSDLFNNFKESATEGNLKNEWLDWYQSKQDRTNQIDVIKEYLSKYQRGGGISAPYSYVESIYSLLREKDPKELEQYFEAFKKNKRLRELMSKYYEETNQSEKLQNLLEDNVSKAPNNTNASKDLLDFYRKQEQPENEKREIWRSLNCGLDVSLPLLERLKVLETKEEWKQSIKSLISDFEFSDVLTQLWLHKENNNLNEVEQILKQKASIPLDRHGSLSLITKYVEPYDDFVSSHDASFIPKLITNFVLRNLETTQSRTNNYIVLANHLKYLCDRSERERMARACAKEIMTRYKNRPSMMKAFREAGFSN